MATFSWATRTRQARAHLTARVAAGERRALEGWLNPTQLAVFDRMPVADRRHGLDVVAWLRRAGATDPELLLAGLLHDCGKGPTVRFVHRVTWSLGEAWGPWVTMLVVRLPTFRGAFDRLRDHAELSAHLALGAGCSARTADLIRHQDDPIEPVAGGLLHAADEAN